MLLEKIDEIIELVHHGRRTEADLQLSRLRASVGHLQTCAAEAAEHVAANKASYIEAIRLYRAATGRGLKDSKDHIDKFRDLPKPDTRLDALERRVRALESGQSEERVICEI